MRVALKKLLWTTGIAIAIVGLTLNAMGSTLMKGESSTIAPGGSQVEVLPIKSSFQGINVTFFMQVEVTPSISENISIVLLNSSEYARFTQGISVVSLAPITIFSGLEESSNSTLFEANISLTTGDSVYLVIQNLNPQPVYTYCYFSVTAAFYAIGLIIAVCGTLCIILGLAWQMAGWKRWMILGIGV
ncbi:MAG TPA: hypothetical protein VKK79_11745, partial [Candidatus Lokiarchaeia archaeon]|nr:hypothetical protein [Candidatus Lokiarchaeia archaeon]